ncbi:hypothetical protein BJ165DRAFT_1534943 [Panaeolus papilionaceus]|nr:hypothetical protein BJ165DRAFT_1534943 [Panaeolus papilionaceus]
MSFELDLNGCYTYTSWSSLGDDGHSTFRLDVNPNAYGVDIRTTSSGVYNKNAR